MLVSFRGLFYYGKLSAEKAEASDAKACIATAHDVILGLIKGDCSVKEIKNFMFSNLSDEEIKAIPYEETIIFDKKKINLAAS